MNRIIQLIIVPFLIVACTHSWMGKTLPAANYPQFSNGIEGHHTIKFEKNSATLDYDWFINEKKDRICLIGTFDINVFDWKIHMGRSWKSGNIIFDTFLLDQNYKVISVEQILIPIDMETSMQQYKFKKSFTYKQEYKYVSYRLLLSIKSMN